jgi:hypothetical protein
VKVDTSLANQMAPAIPQQQGAPVPGAPATQPGQQPAAPAQNQNAPVPLAQ